MEQVKVCFDIMNYFLNYRIHTLIGTVSVMNIVAFAVLSGLVVYLIRELLM